MGGDARRPRTSPDQNAMRLFRHARLAQSLVDACEQLPVRRAGERQRNRRKLAERRYSRSRTSFQVGGERRARLLGATEEAVGRREKSVRRGVLGIGVERAGQRADGFLIAPEKNESVASTVQPGPPSRVARADAIGLGEPFEGLV